MSEQETEMQTRYRTLKQAGYFTLTTYRQRDGKHVILRDNRPERFLPSGDRDPEPIAATPKRPDEEKQL